MALTLVTDTDSVTETDSVGDCLWRGRGWISVCFFDGFHLARLN